MAIREGKWKCPNCDTVNRGRDMDCKGCGATREPDVKFFLVLLCHFPFGEGL